MSVKATMAALLALLGRFLLFYSLWWVLTDGRADALVLGLGFAAAAALVPLLVAEPEAEAENDADARPGAPWMQGGLLPTVLRLPLLMPFFFWESLRGGTDVALRALRPRMLLSPAMLDYRLRLPPGPAPVMMASLVSLMPGTLAIIHGNRLRVHVLDDSRGYQDELERLEDLVARVFGLALAPSQTGAADAA